MRRRILLGLVLTCLPGALLAACGSSSDQPKAAPAPGAILHLSALSGTPAGTRGWRVVYETTTAAGRPAESSGTIYAPSGPPPRAGRPVVAWAHPTIGDAAQCTPSAQADPSAAIPGFAQMMAKGWVVASTDYTGLGSPGTLPYLVGRGEAHDVLDAVRAARHVPEAHAGATFAVWGWSQGGNASLFSAQLARSYAPELHLVGSASAAPAAELVPLFSAQYDNNAVVWFIAPEVLSSWPVFYPGLPTKGLVTPFALANFRKAGSVCISASPASAVAMVPFLSQPFFLRDPMDVAAWRSRAQENTPAPDRALAYFVAQGSADTVVLPSTTALLEKSWCAQGVRIEVDDVAGASHLDIASLSASATLQWLSGRFAARRPPSSC